MIIYQTINKRKKSREGDMLLDTLYPIESIIKIPKIGINYPVVFKKHLKNF